MSDRMAAKIIIGGNLPKEVMQELLEMASGYSVENFGGPEFRFNSAKKLRTNLKNALERSEDGKRLYLYDDQASWGEFADIEQFCQENGIPFDRYTASMYEYPAEKVMFRTGMESPIQLECSSSDEKEAIVPESIVKKAIEAIRKDPTDFTSDAVKQLEEYFTPELEEVPPLTIKSKEEQEWEEEEEKEQQRRDEKRGLYPGREDISN